MTLDNDGTPHLTLLDCGLVVEFGPKQHATVVKILGAFARRDGLLAGQLMVDNDSTCQASALDVDLFVKGIEQICLDDECQVRWRRDFLCILTQFMSQVIPQNFVEHVGDYITDICYLACRHRVKLEAAFINAALSVEIIEGIASALYPDIRVSKTALPMVLKAEMMHRFPLNFGL